MLHNDFFIKLQFYCHYIMKIMKIFTSDTKINWIHLFHFIKQWKYITVSYTKKGRMDADGFEYYENV